MRLTLACGALIAGLLTCSGAVVPAVAQSQQPSPASDQYSEAETLARAYISAYSATDWDAMAALMSEDFVFVDRTSPDLAGTAFEGRNAALRMFRDFSREGHIVGLFLEFPVVFESQGVVVFSGYVNTLSRSADPDYALRWRAEQVIVLTVRDGRVVRHEDYANYSAPVITRERLKPDQ